MPATKVATITLHGGVRTCDIGIHYFLPDQPTARQLLMPSAMLSARFSARALHLKLVILLSTEGLTRPSAQGARLLSTPYGTIKLIRDGQRSRRPVGALMAQPCNMADPEPGFAD